MRHAVALFPDGSQELYHLYQFSPAVKVGSTLYLAGIIGMTPDYKATNDAAEEYHAAFRHIAHMLEKAGGSMADIVTGESYHVSNDFAADVELFVKIKGEYIKAPYPAWTAIGVAALGIPGGRCEIRVTAQ